MIDSEELLMRSLDLTTRLDQHSTLQAFVESAIALTGAAYGALSVLDPQGKTNQFVYSGVENVSGRLMGHPPMGYGIFGTIPEDTYLISNDLANDFAAFPWPANHVPMNNFLGVPLTVQDRPHAQLYLAEKPEDFTEADGEAVMYLSRAASIALENSRVFGESVRRSQWIAASRAITTALLEGTDEEDALRLIAYEMRRTAKADIALIILQGMGDAWTCEIADGENSARFIGIDFPTAGRAQNVIREGEGLIVDSMSRQDTVLVPELREFGAALYAPMVANGSPMGAILLIRGTEKQEFDLSDLAMAESVAKQAALALKLADARHVQAQAAQLEDRAQISRDLHDLAIQQLFASGMELTAVRNDLAETGAAPESALESLDNAISSIDESVSQIRQIIYSLRDPQATVPVVQRLRREIEHSVRLLGFTPDLDIWNLGEHIGPHRMHTEIDDEVGADVADDIVAVVRECLANAAKHAEASTVSVRITIENHRVEIIVEDDGKGVSQELSRRSGLSNLAARARRHHGTFSIRPGASKIGTRITWTAQVD